MNSNEANTKNETEHPALTPDSMDMNNNSPQTVATNGDSDYNEPILTTLNLPNIDSNQHDNNKNHGDNINVPNTSNYNINNTIISNFSIPPQNFSVGAYIAPIPPMLIPVMPIPQSLPPLIPDLEFEKKPLILPSPSQFNKIYTFHNKNENNNINTNNIKKRKSWGNDERDIC